MPEADGSSLSTTDLVKKYEQIIKSAPGGAEIIYPETRPFPEMDLSSVPDRDKVLVKMAVDSAKKLLQKPTITDNFPSHAERRGWLRQKQDELRNSQGEEARDGLSAALGANMLKKANASLLVGYSDWIKPYMPEAVARIDTLRAQYFTNDPVEDETQLVDKWETIPLKSDNPESPSKMKAIGEMQQIATQIIDHFAQKQPQA